MENLSSLQTEPPHQVMPLWQEKDLRSLVSILCGRGLLATFQQRNAAAGSVLTGNIKYICVGNWAQPTSTAPVQEGGIL